MDEIEKRRRGPDYMPVKEKVITEALNRIDKRLKEIREVLDTNIVSEIIEGREKARKIICDNKDHKETMKLLGPLINREKKLFKMGKQNIVKLTEEECRLEIEKIELWNEFHSR